jgi:hypothetical protein
MKSNILSQWCAFLPGFFFWALLMSATSSGIGAPICNPSSDGSIIEMFAPFPPECAAMVRYSSEGMYKLDGLLEAAVTFFPAENYSSHLVVGSIEWKDDCSVSGVLWLRRQGNTAPKLLMHHARFSREGIAADYILEDIDDRYATNHPDASLPGEQLAEAMLPCFLNVDFAEVLKEIRLDDQYPNIWLYPAGWTPGAGSIYDTENLDADCMPFSPGFWAARVEINFDLPCAKEYPLAIGCSASRVALVNVTTGEAWCHEVDAPVYYATGPASVDGPAATRLIWHSPGAGSASVESTGGGGCQAGGPSSTTPGFALLFFLIVRRARRRLGFHRLIECNCSAASSKSSTRPSGVFTAASQSPEGDSASGRVAPLSNSIYEG